MSHGKPMLDAIRYALLLPNTTWFLSIMKDDPYNKKALGGTHTLRADCSKVEPFFCPAADPLPGVQDGQNLISWRWSHYLTYRSMHAISSYRGNRPTKPQTHKQTGLITIHCAAS